MFISNHATPADVIGAAIGSLILAAVAGLVVGGITAVIARYRRRKRTMPLAKPEAPDGVILPALPNRSATSCKLGLGNGLLVCAPLWGYLWFGTIVPWQHFQCGCMYSEGYSNLATIKTAMDTRRARWGGYDAPDAMGYSPEVGNVEAGAPLGVEDLSSGWVCTFEAIAADSFACRADSLEEEGYSLRIDETGLITGPPNPKQARLDRAFDLASIVIVLAMLGFLTWAVVLLVGAWRFAKGYLAASRPSPS